ncbi:hypothetical protein Taro_042834 [Colocasia esculenta]|uniref:phospholipase D n=1 Tax=Colocasia esculenta TaxID=4460 RepID=A0A843WQL1_COLES|nr:hypothetical protein [Colocasia esculenta]
MDNSNHSGRADPYPYGYPPPGSRLPYQYPPAPANHSQSTYPAPYAYPSCPPPSGPAAPQPEGSFRYDVQPHTRVDSSSSYAASPYSAVPPAPFGAYSVADHLGSVRLSDQKPSSGAPLPSYHQVPGMYVSPSQAFSGSPSPHVPHEAPAGFAGRSQQGGSSHSSQRVLLLHGSLDIWLIEARNLPNMDMFSKSVTDILGQTLTSLTGKSGDQHADSITSDPYVSISVAGAVLGRTWVISNSENPVWGQHFCLPVAHHTAEVRFWVKDSDVVGSQLIGTVSIPAAQLYTGEKVEGTYPVLGGGGEPCKAGATLKLSIQYIPVGAAGTYGQGVAAGVHPHYGGVSSTYFPLRRGGKLTLYQDADVPEGSLPAVALEQGKLFEHGRCWRDVFEAIGKARRLVYIAGWSVYHKVRLLRDAAHEGADSTLGDLLKTKAQEGVRVLLLVWDDPTSRTIMGCRTRSARDRPVISAISSMENGSHGVNGEPSYGYPPPNSAAPYAYPSYPPPRSYLGHGYPSMSHSGPLQYPPPVYSAPPHPFPSYPSFSYAPPYQAASPSYAYPGPAPPPPDPIPPQRPALHHHGSFQYDVDVYAYPPPGQSTAEAPPRPHLRAESFHGYPRQDSALATSAASVASPPDHVAGTSSSSYSASTSAYPMNDLLANMRLSDHAASEASSPSMNPSVPSHYRPGLYGYQSHSFHGISPSHSPSAPSSPFSGSHHGHGMQIIPFQPSLRVLLLHGSLDIRVYEARNLPNMDMFSKTIGDLLGKRFTSGLSGKLEEHHIPSMTSDPYVSFSVSNAVLGRTYVISNSENPIWNQHFYVPVAHSAAEVRFVVKDSDVVGAQLIGTVSIPVEQIYGGGKVEGAYPILGSNGKPCKPGATLKLSIQYIPIERLSIYHHGVGRGPDYVGVEGTYFPLRKGGKVTLYQDAHVPDGCLPDLKLEKNMHYEHGKCWRDIFEAIRLARRLVYITGWSVYHKVQLIRDPGFRSDTLGELLSHKSQEGVRVLLLIWDDPTSRSILGYKTDGFMKTHDEETRRFFKHSSVQVLLCPRSAGKRHSWVKQQEVSTIYTHHQKTVIVDYDAGNNKRKIVAFVGGLDLCDGRYDTPKHHLFRTLKTSHKDDYHNPTFVNPDTNGPREPWHDLHCRIDGPAAYDVLRNFEERWLKASKPHGIKKLKRSDDALLRIERIPDIIGVHDTMYVNDDDPEAWHVQIFRSIDSNSVKGFPKDPKEATMKNLVCGKNVLIDMSIHTAYVKAIRSAQHFIYIENQYFLGSSYNWSSHKDLGANNLIPMEIALKIASKIKANERFSAYIVIPMWPEGDPKSNAMQRILYWQNKTMQMMYETIYKALVEAGLENMYVPQDYLNFFCLGNREALDGSGSQIPPTSNASNALSQKSRRFMIYVHSKGMIVDDEYVIIGSANINQRSLEGTRDTEIAMGAYQPQHTWARKLSAPCGQIYGYRMSLWSEHTGTLEECFTSPESLECMRRIRTMGEMNWRQFHSDDVTEIKGHLLKYPVDVDNKGKVQPLAGCECFPDVGGNICGAFLAIQENLTI